MAMTYYVINVVKNTCSEVLRTLKKGFKFSFYFVNLLQFCKKVGMFSTKSFFFFFNSNKALLFSCLWYYLVFRGSYAETWNKRRYTHSWKWVFHINLKNAFSWYILFYGFTLKKKNHAQAQFLFGWQSF